MLIATPITSARLRLGNLDTSHAHGPYLRWMQNPEVLRFLEARLATQTLESISAFIANMNESVTDLLLGIFLKKQNEHIGNIKLGGINNHHRRADIGILIGPEAHWGQGYASEAIDALSSYAGRELGLHRVYAGCHSNNPGSFRSFQKAGFVEEGRMRHHARVDGKWVDGLIYGRILSV
jgi:[ribosomal protein S5]-alanine N-acetyltransferase